MPTQLDQAAHKDLTRQQRGCRDQLVHEVGQQLLVVAQIGDDHDALPLELRQRLQQGNVQPTAGDGAGCADPLPRHLAKPVRNLEATCRCPVDWGDVSQQSGCSELLFKYAF